MSLVYSTEHGRHCAQCGKPKPECICRAATSAGSGDGIVRIQRQVQGRGGKTVTVITGIALAPDALKALAKELKTRCGSGGAIRDGVVEIQGDHRELLRGELERRGFKVKLSGG